MGQQRVRWTMSERWFVLNRFRQQIDRRCGRNEEYSDCGSACPETCDRFKYPMSTEPTYCIAMCVEGCFCKPGFYRSSRGRCVAAEECCDGLNEVFTECGSACVETCNYKPDSCTEQCVMGCFCKSSDYVRRDNTTGSNCIHRSECSWWTIHKLSLFMNLDLVSFLLIPGEGNCLI